MTQLSIRGIGKTDVGRKRETNEDAVLVDGQLGLYVVLDGMGGHNAGHIASTKARDVIHEYVRARAGQMEPADLVTSALNAASAAVHATAKSNRACKGMGTTVVLCLLTASDEVLVAHVGDSRAYLLRDGTLRLLTGDHTIVAELLAKNAISPEEANHHPYKSVLSRNIGSKAAARADLVTLKLAPGDRLLLCSDGLNGYGSPEAIRQILCDSDTPEAATSELIELALRGGGGDNVTAIVIEAGSRVVPRATQILRTNGSVAWWARKELFHTTAHQAGLCDSPICSALAPTEALSLVAGNFCEAVYRDLEQTTGINTWSFAENIARGWFARGGSHTVLSDLFDILRASAAAVIADVKTKGDAFATQLEIAVTRTMVVAEMAIGGIVAERLREVEGELVRVQAQTTRADPITQQPTVPHMRAVQPPPPAPAILECLDEAYNAAVLELQKLRKPGAIEILNRLHGFVREPDTVDVYVISTGLCAEAHLTEASVLGIFEAMSFARTEHVDALRSLPTVASVKAAALRRITEGHTRLCMHATQLILEAGAPVSRSLQEALVETGNLRTRVSQEEARISAMSVAGRARAQSTSGRGAP